MATGTPPLRVEEIPGRGRSLVSTRPLRGGEVILRDSPILLYSAIPTTTDSLSSLFYCHKCFKKLPQNGAVTCLTCSSRFCSGSCLSSPSHSPFACLALAKLSSSSLANGLSPELRLQARFLIAAYNLSVVSPPDFSLLLSLQGDGAVNGDVWLLHSAIAPADAGFPPETTAALLAKDKLNAFGLMEPFDEDGKGRRSVRGYGIYPRAAFFNHDCLPNACRFDYVDGGGEANSEIVVRMIHDVPEGREVCLSYFPVNLGFAERQKRLVEDYGFRCGCDRCRVESNWSDHEGDDGAMEEDGDDGDEEEAMEAGSGGDEDDNDVVVGGGDDGDGGGDDFPHAYFFVKFVCSREHCGGTLAPLPGSSQSNLMECNVCGNVQKDEVV